MNHEAQAQAEHLESYDLLPVQHQSEEQPISQSESGPKYYNPPPKEWTSRWLQIHGILPAAFTAIALIVIIVTLAVISRRRHGITSISLQSESLSTIVGVFDVGIGLLWTTLPGLIFSIYGLVISAIVKEAAARQPYIELREYEDPNLGAPAKNSILLNYASYLAIEAPWRAFHNRHLLLAYSFSISLIVSITLSALSAYILHATTIPFGRPISIQQTSDINELGLTARDSLVPTMNTVSSTLIYGGQNIPWTTNNASIMPFSLPQTLRGASAWNLTTPAIAHTARMDCRVLGDSEFELVQVERSSNWYFSMRDRGCSSNNQLFAQLSNGLYTHIVGMYWAECSLEAYYGRVVVVAAKNLDAGQTLTSKIGISCIPSYYNVTGTLDVTSDHSSPSGIVIRSFTPSKFVRIDPYPVFGSTFAGQLHQPTVDDPTATLLANSFGSLIFYAANDWSGEAFLNATASLYIGAFAVMTQMFLVQPSSSTSTVTGTVYTNETRVVVVQAVAYTVVGILAGILIMLAWIWWYTRNHHSIQYEPSTALVGAAATLRNSDLMSWTQRIDADQWGGQVANAFEYEHGKDSKGWRVDQWTRPKYMSIISTDRARITSI